MRSVTDTREQLIELATESFANNGFEKTSLRSIARMAGVSPGLLVHHFKSRAALIETCIEINLGEWIGEKVDLMSKPLSESLSQWQATVDTHGIKLNFFRQVLLAGGQNATHLFERMIDEAEQILLSDISAGKMREVNVPRDMALIMVLHGLAPLILRDQINAALGGDFMDSEIGPRLAKTTMEIYTNGIYTKAEDGEK